MALLQRNTLPPSGTLDGYIDRMAKGDTQALEQLYRAAAPGVYAYALSILKNSHDAQDVLQDTFLTVHSSAASYRSQEKPMAWILTIAKNLCYKRLKELQRSGTASLDGFALVDNRVSTDDKLVIEACMNVLSDEERQIVVLHAVSGFKHREIARMLSLPLSTVISKYHRALKKMKASL
ncbi:MAG: RNA polymerase sigma factor [Ruminococcaceae bacterium]|nr:RNA polymerase sigma factor [Oscillospiraceae bacterium]